MGNEQGGHYFLSLHSGKRLKRYSWTESPMPNEVIAQIHCLAVAAEKYDGIVFTDVSGNRLPKQINDEYQDDATSNTEEQSAGNMSDASDDEGNTSISQQMEDDKNGINDGNMDELPKLPTNEEEEIVTEELYEEGKEDPYED